MSFCVCPRKAQNWILFVFIVPRLCLFLQTSYINIHSPQRRFVLVLGKYKTESERILCCHYCLVKYQQVKNTHQMMDGRQFCTFKTPASFVSLDIPPRIELVLVRFSLWDTTPAYRAPVRGFTHPKYLNFCTWPPEVPKGNWTKV